MVGAVCHVVVDRDREERAKDDIRRGVTGLGLDFHLAAGLETQEYGRVEIGIDRHDEGLEGFAPEFVDALVAVAMAHRFTQIQRMQQALAAQGYTDLSARLIAQLHLQDFDPAYIQQLADAGLTDVSLRMLLKLWTADVEPAFVKEALAQQPDLTARKILQRYHFDVDFTYNFDVDEDDAQDAAIEVEMALEDEDDDA